MEPVDALIVPAATAEGGRLSLTATTARVDDLLGGELSRLAADARFVGKRGTFFRVSSLGRLAARRVVLAGVGSLATLDAEAIRRAWGPPPPRPATPAPRRSPPSCPPTGNGLALPDALAAAAEGVRLATYRFTKYHGAGRQSDPVPRELETLTFTEDGLDATAAAAALARAEAIAAGVALARDLVNEPASVLTPGMMADHARRVAAEHDLEIEVLGPDQLRPARRRGYHRRRPRQRQPHLVSSGSRTAPTATTGLGNRILRTPRRANLRRLASSPRPPTPRPSGSSASV